MIRSALLAVSAGLAGCGTSPAEAISRPAASGRDPARVVAVATTTPGVPSTARPVSAQPPKVDPQAPANGFEYPSDLGGQVAARVLAPNLPAPKPVERFGTEPRLRTPPARVIDPERVEKAVFVPSPILPPKPAEVKLGNPPERVPLALGVGAEAIPQKPTLPVGPGITERARDVNLPPAMPTLGRPLNDRVSLEDPTLEFGHTVIVGPPVKVPLATAEFLKVTLPDPFELGEQIRPKVPPSAEPGLAPVTVNPQRAK